MVWEGAVPRIGRQGFGAVPHFWFAAKLVHNTGSNRRFLRSRYVLPAWTCAHHGFGATAQEVAPPAVAACLRLKRLIPVC